MVSLISGCFTIGDYVEIKPGFVIRSENGTIKYRPILSNVVSLQSDSNKMDYALPGGLIGVGLNIDPSLTKSNGMVGQMLGHIGTLPNVYQSLELKQTKISRFDNINEDFKVSETIMINVNSMNINAKITSIKENV